MFNFYRQHSLGSCLASYKCFCSVFPHSLLACVKYSSVIPVIPLYKMPLVDMRTCTLSIIPSHGNLIYATIFAQTHVMNISTCYYEPVFIFLFFFSKFVKYINFQRHQCLLVSHFQKFIYCTLITQLATIQLSQSMIIQLASMQLLRTSTQYR